MAKLTLVDIAAGYGSVLLYNSNNDLLEAALENTLSRDGTGPNQMEANLDLNSNRILNLPDPVAAQEPATKSWVEDNFSDSVDAALLRTQLASNINGEGASLVGIEDAGAVFTATTVEAALDELEGRLTTTETNIGTNDTDISNLQSTDTKVRVSADDTTPNYLENKIIAGTGIVINTLNPAGNEQIEINANAVLPVGTIITWAGINAPSGFLYCVGTSLSTTTYAALFNVLGYRYGGSGGSFNLPDYRGEFLRGMDESTGNDPDAASRTDRGDGTTGNAVGTRQLDELKSHKHEIDLRAATQGASDGAAGTDGNYNIADSNNIVKLTGGNETRPRNVYVKYMIKY